jgi:hypothetical protein
MAKVIICNRVHFTYGSAVRKPDIQEHERQVISKIYVTGQIRTRQSFIPRNASFSDIDIQ